MRFRDFFSFYRFLLRPLLFLGDAERVHKTVTGLAQKLWARAWGRSVTRFFYVKRPRLDLSVPLAGLTLPNPLGLAAGFDKDATLVGGLESLGFGFAEVGTVTPRPQPGNPQPRLFRITDKQAILNRMGFNNNGMDAIFANVAKALPVMTIPVGVNIGKNKDTPQDQALRDYEVLFEKFKSVASYFTVNVSSPNTPGLRDLQNITFLTALGEKIKTQNLKQPVFIKLAPDLNSDELSVLGELCAPGQAFCGFVLTNTIATDLGGISGLPLRGPATQMLSTMRNKLDASVPLISVGGIFTLEDVLTRLRLGAQAVQLYTGLIYQGPGLVGRLLYELERHLRRKGIKHISDLRER